MYFTASLSTILLLLSAAYADTTDQIDQLSSNLAGMIETLDITVAELTTASNPNTATGLPVDFQNVNLAINAALNEVSQSPTTFSPEANAEANTVETYGMFANQAEEMLSDFVQKEGLLANTFGVHTDIYNQLSIFNFTFYDWHNFNYGIYPDAAYKANISLHIINSSGNIAGTAAALQQALNAYS